MREEWIEALVSQGEDADYLEKLSNKEIYRAFMGQQGLLANKKRAEEEEKAKQKSKKTIAFNKRSHEERKVMIDFLKARGESQKRLGPMSFMNLQALYFEVKKEEEERLGRKAQRRGPPSTPPTKSKSSHPAPTHQQPPKKKSKPTTKLEDSREIVNWFYSTQDQRFEVFKGRTEERRSIYTTVDEVLQLPDSDLRRTMELGEANEPENEGGRHLLLDEFTLTDVKGKKMRCSSKAIFKMASKDIKTLSELPLNNHSKDQRGFDVARIVSNMEKLQQQKK
ncbi:hypothetical protein L1987_06619 [Smallanthus sonchifolius]|uniref:Uncharacterized protein n=1 Tax=Smallanthus sonchifolius TaxID=185202 RepID=A0ACB9JYU1_9ASTR|nr:hypothetical protein L1987_06619 [Smallanthus sonchifolius]